MAAFATPERTRRYAARFADTAAPGHFRQQPGAAGLLLSSLGIGTYLGEPDDATDRAYTESVVAALAGGINVLDAAINYRFQRSERSIGAALKRLVAMGYAREEIILCSKGGFLTPDGALPANPAEYFFREFVESGVLRVDDIVAGCHAMTPRYLENQLERSRANLGVECIDAYYLHNPETQLGTVSRAEFAVRVRAAFEFLESAVAAGKIRFYGMATWNGFRQPPSAQDYLSLAEIESLGRDVAGAAHHFCFVQLPYNLGMTDALTRANQKVGTQALSMVEAAEALGITLVGSAALLQGRVARNLPGFIGEVLGLENDVQRALQFARSTPGITTALVGTRRVEHIRENLKLVSVEPTPPDRLARLFNR